MYAYQWQRDFGEGYVDIAGATGSSYTLTVADVDALVRVVVTATNPDATIVEASEPTTPVLAAGPLNQTPPTVTRQRAARPHADRHGRHLERLRQQHQPTSGSPRPTARSGRTIAGATERHLRASRSATSAAICACS